MSPLETRSAPPSAQPEGAGDPAGTPRWVTTLGEALRFAVAAVIAAALTWVLQGVLPRELDVRTDVVGYPTWANFNVHRYVWTYALAVGFFPLTTLALFAFLSRRRGARAPAAPARRPRERVAAVDERTLLAPAARTLFVGSVLGLEAAIAVRAAPQRVIWIVLGSSLAYGFIVAGAAWALHRRVFRARSTLELAAAGNGLAAVLTGAGLLSVSAHTEVTVETTGRVYEYAWLPMWAAVLLAVSAAGLGLTAARRHGAGVAERRLLVGIVGPVALFLLLARLPGTLPPFDTFHEGQRVVPAEAIRDGAFPWRDLIFVHGLLSDIARPLIGFSMFEDSRWGASAGDMMVVYPLAWITQYYLLAWLLRRNWLLLVGTQVAVVGRLLDDIDPRFLFVPLVAMALVSLLVEATLPRAIGFSVLLSFQTIVSPEAALAAVPFLLAVVAYETVRFDPNHSVLANFRRAAICGVTILVLALAWLGFLAYHGALDDFISYHVTFLSSGYSLGFGLPITITGQFPAANELTFMALTPVALGIAAIWYVALKARAHSTMSPEDWAMAAYAAFLVLFYYKFLGRADHVRQPFAVAVPVLLYAAYQVLSPAAVTDRGRRSASVAVAPTAGALVVVAIAGASPVLEALRSAPARFAAAASTQPAPFRLSFVHRNAPFRVAAAPPEAIDLSLVREVGRVLDRYVAPGDPVFDFTNSLGLFHYVLKHPRATRYDNVNIVILRRTQLDVVRELRERPPKLVVYGSQWLGLPTFDGVSNPVRHYEISQHLLRHYAPVAYVRGFTLMTPARHAPVTASERELYFRTLPCAWGYSPNFLSTGPKSPNKGARTLRVARDASRVRIYGWAVDVGARAPAGEVIAVARGRVVATARPSRPRTDVAEALGLPGAAASGFAMSAPAGVGGLRLFALTRDGSATALTVGPSARPLAAPGEGVTSLRVPGRDVVPVKPRAARAHVDSAARTIALDLPATARQYGWLELETVSELSTGRFELTDRPAEVGGPRSISFRSLAGHGNRIRIQVGACSQWYGYRPGRLFLVTETSQAVRAVRLLR